MYFLFENTNISTKNSCIKHTTCINVIKRPLKCGQIHIYNKNIYNHPLWKLHKKTPDFPVSLFFGPKPPYDPAV